MRAVVLLAACALGAPAAAQPLPVDCEAEGLTPAEVALCADAALREADAEMDEVFRLALNQAQVFDEATEVERGPDAGPSLEALLEQAQADFLTYRDATCDAEALTYRSTVEAPVAGAICRARLAVRRTEDLRFFGGIE